MEGKFSSGFAPEGNDTLTAVPGIRVGHATDEEGRTGCTVILVPDEGAVAGADVRGGAPGTRETDLLQPGRLVERVNAVVLSGGSAFGLDAASGVMAYLDEQNAGFSVGAVKVPIVPAAVIFDLDVGDPRARPDAPMGYEACRGASSAPVPHGSVGAGTGATIGTMLGPGLASRGGLGSASLAVDTGGGEPLVVGALAVVNSFGDVVDPVSGTKLAGVRNPETGELMDTAEVWTAALALAGAGQAVGGPPGSNTTLAVVATNGAMDRAAAARVATMAHNGMARTIVPVHTEYDGDTVFALSTGDVPAPATFIGALAARAVSEAVVRAVRAAHQLPKG